MPTEFSSFGAAWKANNALGGVKIFLPRPGLTGLEIASDLIGRGFPDLQRQVCARSIQ
jgi:hypothetical protein